MQVPLEVGGHKPFLTQSLQLAGPGKLSIHNKLSSAITKFPFEFRLPPTVLDSFEGGLIKVNYEVRAKILAGGIFTEAVRGECSKCIWVIRKSKLPDFVHMDLPQQVTVGTDDGKLEMIIDLFKGNDDELVNGLIQFKIQRICINSVEVQLVRKEWVGNHCESQAIHRHQVIDGIPCNYDSISFSLPRLRPLPPSLPKNNHRNYGIEYAIAVVLIEGGLSAEGIRTFYKLLPISIEPAYDRGLCPPPHLYND